MPTLDVYNTSRESVGSIELIDSVFGTEVKEHLFHTVVRYQLAKRRSGNHSVKGRSEVSGGGKKPFRQKGTGRARAGTTRAPQWRGGGIVHGPHPRSHAHKLPKKVRRAALCCALSRRCEEKALTVFDQFVLPEVKTKGFVKIMDAFEFSDLLLVVDAKDDNVMRSARNIPKVTVLPVEGLNVYDVLRHRNLGITAAAIESIQDHLSGNKAAAKKVEAKKVEAKKAAPKKAAPKKAAAEKAAPKKAAAEKAAPKKAAPKKAAEQSVEEKGGSGDGKASAVALIGGSIADLKAGLNTGDHDDYLSDILAAEESGRARKGAISAIKSRMG